MTRRTWWVWLFGGAAVASQPMKKRKFYITGGFTELTDAGMVTIIKMRDDCIVPPLVSYGTSRLDAIANSGITVWEEEEWNRSENCCCPKGSVKEGSHEHPAHPAH